jgi:hypothetical protein
VRYLLGFLCVCVLGVLPLVGCSDTVDREVDEQCAYPEGEISNEEYFQGVRCEEGLTEIFASRLLYPCSGESPTCENGCSLPPPCLCFNCSPCGDGQCQCEFGENACNCPIDCD